VLTSAAIFEWDSARQKKRKFLRVQVVDLCRSYFEIFKNEPYHQLLLLAPLGLGALLPPYILYLLFTEIDTKIQIQETEISED